MKRKYFSLLVIICFLTISSIGFAIITMGQEKFTLVGQISDPESIEYYLETGKTSTEFTFPSYMDEREGREERRCLNDIYNYYFKIRAASMLNDEKYEINASYDKGDPVRFLSFEDKKYEITKLRVYHREIGVPEYAFWGKDTFVPIMYVDVDYKRTDKVDGETIVKFSSFRCEKDGSLDTGWDYMDLTINLYPIHEYYRPANWVDCIL